MANVVASKDLCAFTCPTCREIFEKPCTLNCGHSFCLTCLHQLPKTTCPVCRNPFTAGNQVMDLVILNKLNTMSTACEGCRAQVRLSLYRGHSASCAQKIALDNLAVRKLVVPESSVAASGPNRQTFLCPYCQQKNFDVSGLVEHCLKTHAALRLPVVCPICAAMPWGDPNYVSANFIEHLKMRHKFEYDTYVDYDQEEEEMMRRAIQASMHQT